MNMHRELRRLDKVMPDSSVQSLLKSGYSACIATVGADGWPYVCPLLFVWREGKVWFHNTGADGHLRTNVLHDPRACLEIDVPGEVYAYGRFACDTTLAYQSVVAFGHVSIEEDESLKTAFFQALMEKYYPSDSTRPRNFFPRLDAITLYSMSLEKVTGKQTELPSSEARWPSTDKTKSPYATPPDDA